MNCSGRKLYCCLALVTCLTFACQRHAAGETIDTDRFGPIEILRPAGSPVQVGLWLRGREEKAEARIARDTLIQKGFVLALVDADRYLEESQRAGGCTQFGEIVRLSQVVQNQLGLAHLFKPVLIGTGAGAGMAYAVALSTEAAFSGYVTEEFCPDIGELGHFCDPRLHEPAVASVTLGLAPRQDLELPGLLLKGTSRALNCGENKSPVRIETIPNVVSVDAGVGSWATMFATALDTRFPPAIPADAGEIADLELVELPASPLGKRLIIFFSGDGGWAAIDKELGSYFQERGVNVVGLSTLRYFWKAKTAQQTASMLANIISHYSVKWRSPEILLAGFSLGADVIPSAFNRMPDRIRSAVDGMILLNPEKKVTFEVKLTDWLDIDSGDGVAALPELLKVRVPLICVFGESEIKDTLCMDLPVGAAQVIKLKGGHHFDGDYRALGARLLELSNSIPG